MVFLECRSCVTAVDASFRLSAQTLPTSAWPISSLPAEVSTRSTVSHRFLPSDFKPISILNPPLPIGYPSPSKNSTTHAYATSHYYPKLSTDIMKANLIQFSGFRTRYYRSETGKQSQAWLLSKIKEVSCCFGLPCPDHR